MGSKAKDAPPVADFDSPEYDAQYEDAGRPAALQERLDAALAAAYMPSGQVAQQSRQQVIADAVDWSLEAALSTIDLLYVARDGVPVTPTSLVHGSWDPEPAPEPCAVDNWLRAAIPESQQPAQSFMLEQFLRNAAGGGTAGGRHSMRLSMTGGARRSTATGSSLTGSPGHAKATQDGGARDAARTAQAVKSFRQPSIGESMVDPRAQERKEAEQRLREELEVRRAQLQVTADLAAKDAEARARIAAIAKELHGKEYCYNHKGEVVPVASSSTTSGPAAGHLMHNGPAFAVKSPHEGSGVKPGRKSPTKLAPAGAADSGKGRSGKQGAAAGSAATSSGSPGPGAAADRKLLNDFKETAPRTQPNALEVMAPSGGVTLRSGTQSKVGPSKGQGARGMSHEELQRYAATLALQQQQQQAAGSAGAGAGRQAGTGRSAGGRQPQSRAGRSAGGAGPAAAGGADGAASTGTSRAGTRSGARPGVSQGSQPAAGLLEQDSSRPAAPAHVFSEGPLAELPDSPTRLTTGAMPLQPAVVAKPPTPDFSPGLVGASDWGRSSSGQGGKGIPAALQTVKPTSRARELEVGRLARLPRDRAPQATSSPPLSPAKLAEAPPAARMTFAAS